MRAGTVVTGSHCDAIPHAGLYDGTLGVIGAIAAVKGLQDAGFKPKRSIEVLFFTSEEPTRFGFGCIGRYSFASAMRLLLSTRMCISGYQLHARSHLAPITANLPMPPATCKQYMQCCTVISSNSSATHCRALRYAHTSICLAHI